MRIISKFRDYYDSVQGVAYDENLTYIRKTTSIKDPEINKFFSDYEKMFLMRVKYSKVCFIGFCEKIIPVILLNSSEGFVSKDRKKVLQTLKHTEVEGYYVFYEINEALIKEICSSMFFWEENVKTFKSKLDQVVKDLESLKLFEKYQSPIFTITPDGHQREHTISLSPCLKDMSFQNIVDPYTALQELAMWIANKAVNEWPPQITDNIVMRDSKGFDKWSFKKKPQKRFKKRKQPI